MKTTECRWETLNAQTGPLTVAVGLIQAAFSSSLTRLHRGTFDPWPSFTALSSSPPRLILSSGDLLVIVSLCIMGGRLMHWCRGQLMLMRCQMSMEYTTVRFGHLIEAFLYICITGVMTFLAALHFNAQHDLSAHEWIIHVQDDLHVLSTTTLCSARSWWLRVLRCSSLQFCLLFTAMSD